MRDIDIIMKAMHDAQALLGAYIEPANVIQRRSCRACWRYSTAKT
jgi:hypothetical protein